MTPDEIKDQLSAPFPPEKIHWRVQRCGISNKGNLWAIVLPYITSRETMDRLDSVMGLEGWEDDIEIKDGSAKCKLSLKLNGNWNTKTGMAGETNIEAIKGGSSDALKRAGYKFGIGRYLYSLDEAHYVENKDPITRDRKEEWNKGTVSKKNNKKGNKYIDFWFKPPELPGWALPDNTKSEQNEDETRANGKLDMETIKSEMQEVIEKQGDAADLVSEQRAQKFAKFWNEKIDGSEIQRYMFLSDILDRHIESSKDLTENEMDKIRELMQRDKDQFVKVASEFDADESERDI